MLLIQLYDATDGKDWNNHKGWLKDSNACDRHGITCTESGGVRYLQSIDLSDNNLQ